MINYEQLDLIKPTQRPTAIADDYKPDLIHLDDPAEIAILKLSSQSVMTISKHASIGNAIFEMRSHDIHSLLVTENDEVIGIISSDDILGNKPIQLLEEKRITREKIQVQMIMSSIEDCIFINTKTLKFARVGNIVRTLKDHKKRYIMVLDDNNKIYGLFTSNRIRRLLHREL